MKKFLIPLIFILFLFLVLLSGLFWWRQNSSAPSSSKEKIRFVISKGKSAQEIANLLKEKNLIRHPLAFKVYVQLKGVSGNIQAGEFLLSENLSLPELINELLKGPSQIWVTIPEGLRKEEVVERFIKGLELDKEKAEVFRREFLGNKLAEEGYMFPDTYLLPRDVNASVVVRRMSEVFDSIITNEAKQALSKSKYSLDEIVTLASLIERETKTDSERPIVAGILYNRLDIGMGLQVDATVQYSIANENCKTKIESCTNWWPQITKENYLVDSTYNTYKYRGLPPSAIANPGRAALLAAIFPQETEYLYYLHDPGGTIRYAKTLAEHNENVRKYLGK